MRATENHPGILKGIRQLLTTCRIPCKIIFLTSGIASTLWFFARVIPKPNRINYPCIQAAAPVMSGFLIYLAGLLSTVVIYKRLKRNLLRTRYVTAAVLLVALLTVAGFLVSSDPPSARADVGIPLAIHSPNQVMGTGQGIFPGRVVWVWNPESTNENCVPTNDGDGWWLPKNNNQDVVDQMLQDAVLKLTGESTVAQAWDALFRHHNKKKNGTEAPYEPGEKILLKLNITSSWGAGESWGNMDENFEKNFNWAYGISETSPQVVLAVLRQLVNEAGIPQEDISVGDPMKNMYQHQYEMWHTVFPDVKYLGNHHHYAFTEQDLLNAGRTPVVEGGNELIYYSDDQVITAGVDLFYTVTEEADYMINIPALKAHARAGITLTAKNHFGSHTRSGANHLHPGLVYPNANEGDGVLRPDYKIYRVQVDLMGYRLLGGNTMLCLIDALWAGSEATDPPTKWDMAPFNGDWTSSLILSQDQVAVESVCFDFLRSEYDGTGSKVNYPNMSGVDDYLMQAADPANWPADFVYAPDGTNKLESLGVHEHWNSPEDKAYSRNLGMNEGIELVSVPAHLVTSASSRPGQAGLRDHLMAAYPNPFLDVLNMKFRVSSVSEVILEVYDLGGKRIYGQPGQSCVPGEHILTWDGRNQSGTSMPAGMYFTTLTIISESGRVTESKLVHKL